MPGRDTALELSAAYLSEHPRRGARLLETRPVREIAALFERLDADVGAPVLAELAPGAAVEAVSALSPELAAALLQRVPYERAAPVIWRMAAERREEVFAAMSPAKRELLAAALHFQEGSVGAVMQPDVVAVRSSATVGAARLQVRRHRNSVRYYVYVTDDGGRLVGVLSLRDLMLAAGGEPVSTIMRSSPARIRVDAGVDDLVTHSAWENYHALPVVDADNALVGRVRFETVRRLERREAEGAGAGPASVDLAVQLCEAWLKGMSNLMGQMFAGDRRTPPRR
jgi:magnesium transporter